MSIRSTLIHRTVRCPGRTGAFHDAAQPVRAAHSTYQLNRTQKEQLIKVMNDVHGAFRRQGLVRPIEGRLLGGVFAGVGRRFGLDPWPARLLFTVLLLVIPGSQILLYPVLWILMPSEARAVDTLPPYKHASTL